MIDFTLSQLMMRICAVLLISTIQGGATAAAAALLGDKSPGHDGRLSIDPLRHVDPLGGAVALVFAIGWSRWVAIDPRALRHGRLALVLVVAAGCAAVLLGVVALRIVRPVLLPLLPDTAAATAFQLIQTGIEMGLSFALLGLLPLPPLLGGHLLIAALPKLGKRLSGLRLLVGLAVAALVAAGVLERALDPAFRFLTVLILGEDVGM